jgi:hypothetical protein
MTERQLYQWILGLVERDALEISRLCHERYRGKITENECMGGIDECVSKILNRVRPYPEESA